MPIGASGRPCRDTRLTQRFVVEIGREHRDILRHAHVVLRSVGRTPCGELAVEDQQVARIELDILDRVAGDVRLERIGAGGLFGPPIVDLGEHTGHALEAANVSAPLC